MEMTKKIYLEPLKSVLGHSIFHYYHIEWGEVSDKGLRSFAIGGVDPSKHQVNFFIWRLEQG